MAKPPSLAIPKPRSLGSVRAPKPPAPAKVRPAQAPAQPPSRREPMPGIHGGKQAHRALQEESSSIAPTPIVQPAPLFSSDGSGHWSGH